MPKVLIKEWDKSTTGISTASNFAVVVPAYFGTPKSGYDLKDILVAQDVYKISSKADFINYIGKHVSTAVEWVAPVLEQLTAGASVEPTEGLVEEEESEIEIDDITKYFRAVDASSFDSYYEDKDHPVYIYRATEVANTDDRYGKNGYLLKTFTVLDGAGNPSKITYELEKINSSKDIEWNPETGTSLDDMYCKIAAGNEGEDEKASAHVGNQMAYELVGLGYTVLLKKLDPAASLAGQLNDATFWEPLKDKSVFNFRYITTGGWYSPLAMNCISDVAKFSNESQDATLERAEIFGSSNGRGDCIALCDLDEENSNYPINDALPIRTVIENMGAAAGAITGSPYTAIFAPRVIYKMAEDVEFNNNVTFPASFHYLACAARTFSRYAEWYAVAGYSRGISNLSVKNTTVKVGEIAINTLAPRVANSYTDKSINLVLHERGNFYLWGNRTAEALDNKGIVFSHFLNIRQLCCSIKKQLYTACKEFTFDPNSDLLWINFVNAIRPTLEAMKADQGIKGYKITQVANDKKAVLTANIRIVPIEAVEDFDINIYLEDSLTGITVSSNESTSE